MWGIETLQIDAHMYINTVQAHYLYKHIRK